MEKGTEGEKLRLSGGPMIAKKVRETILEH